MTEADAIRFLHHEASRCRSHDDAEAFCLLLPALLRAFGLEPMGDCEAEAFKHRLKGTLAANTRPSWEVPDERWHAKGANK